MNLSSTSAKSWATVVTHSDGQAIIYRYVDAFHEDWDLATQPDRVILSWQYESANGMPSPSEREHMAALEETLEPVVEQQGFATIALVSTGENLREWVYYTQSGDEFFNRLNQALSTLPRFPIEIRNAPDPAWTTYERLRASVVGQA